jgi:uncharacterized membrane protein
VLFRKGMNIKFQYILFAVYLLVAIAGQILQKIGMNQVGVINSTSLMFNQNTIVKILSTPTIWFGLLLSVLGFALWLMVLSNFRMSSAYPFSSIAYLIMTVASYFLLGEHISWNQWVGTSVIVCGCFLLSI